MVLRTEVREDPEVFGELAEPWEELWRNSAAKVPFLRPGWMRIWWGHYGRGRRLRLVSVREDTGRLVGLAPLCTTSGDLGPIEWVGGEDLADFLDFLLWKGMEGPVLDALDEALRGVTGRGGEIVLHFVSEDSPTLAEANPALHEGWNVEITLEESSPWVPLPGDWEAFLDALPGKERHELRRKLGKIQREMAPEFRLLERGDEWEHAMEWFFRLHRKSDAQKARFMTPEREGFFREMAWMFFEEGSLRVTWLEARGEPIASALSFVYGETWGLYNSGYDPRYRELSPGIVLVARTIQRAIDEGLKFYDFLRGRERYKYDLGGRDRDLYCLRLTPALGGEGP